MKRRHGSWCRLMLDIHFGLWFMMAIVSCQTNAQNTNSEDSPELVLPIGHAGSIKAVAFSPDGKYLVSGSMDRTLKLWDVSTGREIRSFTGHTYNVTSVKFSPDGQYILSSGGDIKLWNVSTGREIRSLKGYGVVAFSPDGQYALSGHGDSIVKLWEVSTGREVRTFREYTDEEISTWKGHTHYVISIAFSPDGQYALVCHGDQTRVWDIESGKKVKSMSNSSYLFSPDGRYVLSAEGTIMRLRDMASGRNVKSFRGTHRYLGDYHAVSFSPDSRFLVTKANQRDISLWDVTTGRELRRFRDHAGTINVVTFSPDGKYIASGGGNEIKLWDSSKGNEIRTFRGHTNPVHSVVISPDERYFLSVSWGSMRLWEVATGRWIRSYEGHPENILSVAFSPDGKYIISGSRDQTLKLWDVSTGRKIRTFRGHTGWVNEVAFSPDGKYIISASRDKSLKLWEVSTGHQIRSFRGHRVEVLSVTFSPDGRYVLSGSHVEAKLWDVATGREIRSFQETEFDQTPKIFSTAFSPDSRYVVTGGSQEWLSIWDVSTGEKVHTCKGHTWHVHSVAFSPDGRYIVSGSLDQTLRIWDVSTGREVRTLRGHTGAVNAVNFSQDGKYIVSGSSDGSIKFWKASRGELVLTHLSTGETDYMVTTTGNYYTASRETLRWISFKVGDKIFPFEQFDLALNRPDIVYAKLGKVSPDIIAAYRRLYEKRLKKTGFTEDMIGAEFHMPEVILKTKDIPVSTTSKRFTFKIKATDTKYALDRINVYINDVPVFGIDGISIRSKKVNSIDQDIEVTLANGNNKIQVSCLNTQGAESLKETFSIQNNGHVVKPEVYIVVVGVSKYRDSMYNLQYAAKDAIDVAALYKGKTSLSGKYGDIHILEAVDEKAVRQKIREARSFFMKSKADDLAILFVAGHGIVDDKLNYYFATHDIDFTNPQAKGFPYEELYNLLDGIPALQKLFLMDTCFSGEIEKSETELVVTDARTARSLGGQVKVRAFIDKRGLKAKQRMGERNLKIQEDIFADLRRGTGTVVISSSSGDEYSFESGRWNNGVFTYCLLKGLEENAADRDNDRRVLVYELQDYVLEQVPILTKGGQNPTVRRQNLENNFAVY
jgi:WD40 repeat protein